MPSYVNPKSELAFRTAKAGDHPYLLADGNGLALWSHPSGTGTWLFRYRRPCTGNENFVSLGPYPDVTLADARRLATTARNIVREGIDPVAYRRAESIARKRTAEGAFHLVAQRWLEFKRNEWAVHYACQSSVPLPTLKMTDLGRDPALRTVPRPVCPTHQVAAPRDPPSAGTYAGEENEDGFPARQ